MKRSQPHLPTSHNRTLTQKHPTPAARASGQESDLHIWKHPEDDRMVATFTISVQGRALCHELPLDDALHCVRDYLEEL